MRSAPLSSSSIASTKPLSSAAQGRGGAGAAEGGRTEAEDAVREEEEVEDAEAVGGTIEAGVIVTAVDEEEQGVGSDAGRDESNSQ